jgi:hypothetical protein
MTCKDHSPCIQARTEEIEMNHEWERTKANTGQDSDWTAMLISNMGHVKPSWNSTTNGSASSYII